MDVEECLKEWDDLVTDYKRLEVYLLYKKYENIILYDAASGCLTSFSFSVAIT